MSKEPIQRQDKYVLRLPDGMRERIKAAAELSNRSMNAEIIARLEESLDNSIFELAVKQSKTMDEQGKTIQVQSEALQAQAKVLDLWRDNLQRMESSLASFAVAFDEASRGDSKALDGFLELAKKKPLPESLRRAAKKPDEQPFRAGKRNNDDLI